jgi:glycosyltransferase involved in cell wall biosynthesis
MFGNAETARTFVSLYQESGLDYFLLDIDARYHIKVPDEELKPLKRKIVRYPLYKKNLFFVNGNAIGALYRSFPQYFKDRYNMAVWWWEFETGMESYIEGFKYLDEVIVYTDFIKNALMKLPIGGCKISKMTYPFVENWQVLRTGIDNRDFHGLRENDFIFFFNFDYYSSYRKKNPEAVVEAFSKAFKNDRNVRLLIKTTNSQNFPEQVNIFRRIINDKGIDRQVLVLDEDLSRNEMITLISTIDCYVSLHRGEGLGLGMLEAMSLGKPVIATAYGGNTEFMNHENSMLVQYKMVKANDDYPLYKDVKYWADPDIEQAAYYMQSMANDKNKREIYKIKSQESILNKYDKRKIIKELCCFMK